MNAPPTHVIAPTGSYDVYTYDQKTGVAALHLACGDDHGRAAIAMRRAPGTACIARGGVVTSLASGTPSSLVAGLKAAVKAAHAGGAAEAALAVEAPAANPSKTSKCSRSDCDEPSANARGCAPSMVLFCRRHRTAAMAMRVQYKLTDEEAAQRCIDNGSATPPPKFSAAEAMAKAVAKAV